MGDSGELHRQLSTTIIDAVLFQSTRRTNPHRSACPKSSNYIELERRGWSAPGNRPQRLMTPIARRLDGRRSRYHRAPHPIGCVEFAVDRLQGPITPAEAVSCRRVTMANARDLVRQQPDHDAGLAAEIANDSSRVAPHLRGLLRRDVLHIREQPETPYTSTSLLQGCPRRRMAVQTERRPGPGRAVQSGPSGLFNSMDGWLLIAALVFVLAVVFGAIDARQIDARVRLVPTVSSQ